jgi:hypothetical protein
MFDICVPSENAFVVYSWNNPVEHCDNKFVITHSPFNQHPPRRWNALVASEVNRPIPQQYLGQFRWSLIQQSAKPQVIPERPTVEGRDYVGGWQKAPDNQPLRLNINRWRCGFFTHG